MIQNHTDLSLLSEHYGSFISSITKRFGSVLVASIFLTVLLTGFSFQTTQAQDITIDGWTADTSYTTMGTSPADSDTGFTGGIVSLRAHKGPDSLYIAVEGKLRNGRGDNSYRDIILFINADGVNGVPAGTALPGGTDAGSPFYFQSSGAPILDRDTDYGIRLTGGNDPVAYASIVEYAGIDPALEDSAWDRYEGTLSSLDGTPLTGGATGARYAYRDTSDLNSVDGSGFELALPYDSLAIDGNDSFQFFAFYASHEQNSVSATLIPDDGLTRQYSLDEDWTMISGTQYTSFLGSSSQNQAPSAISDSYSIQTGGTLDINAPGVLNNDSDPEGDNLTASLTSNVSHGSIVFNSDGSFTYTPNTGFTGTDSFTYIAEDSSNTAETTVTINVEGETSGELFALMEAQLQDLKNSASATADIESDGDLDLVVSGEDSAASQVTRVYLNNNNEGTFSELTTSLPGVTNGDVALGDLNGDNLIDIAIAGSGMAGLYINDGSNHFTAANANLTGVSHGSVALGDLNGDNLLDVAITGNDSQGNATTTLYMNDGNGYSPANASIDGISNGDIALGDLNGNNRLDLAIAGKGLARLYMNDSSSTTFSTANAALNGVTNGSVALGDLNGDNLLDVAITGDDSQGFASTTLYMNEGSGSYSPAGANLATISNGDIALGDLNGDNYHDILLSGARYDTSYTSRLYLGDNSGGFSDSGIILPELAHGSISLADIDADNDTDMLLTGANVAGTPRTYLFGNTTDPSSGGGGTDSTNVVVNFKVNTSALPDTLQPYHAIQLRGGAYTEAVGKNIDWNSSSELVLENRGGDYWEGSVRMTAGDSLAYKYWAGADLTKPLQNGSELGWESGENRSLIVPDHDTTITNWYETRQNPFVDVPVSHRDSVGVKFRVNIGNLLESGEFNPDSASVQVRGNLGPLTWGDDTGLQLSRESNSAGNNVFYSGIAYFHKDSLAKVNGELQYKFYAGDFENDIPNRTVTLSSTRDTTLHWKFFNNMRPDRESSEGNQPPVAQVDSITVQMNQTSAIQPLTNDSDADSDDLFIAGLSPGNHGNATVSLDRKRIIYTPVHGYSGSDMLFYRVTDGNNEPVEGRIYIEITTTTGENQAPQLMLPPEISVLEDTSMAVPMSKIVADDSDSLGSLSYQITGGQNTGRTINEGSNQLMLQPDANWWGQQKIYLTAEDSQGLTSHDSTVVTAIPVNDPPQAAAGIASQSSVNGGYQVSFADSSSDPHDPEDAITQWRWEFGDGSVSTDANPTHIYSSQGTYDVQLTVTDNSGAVDSTSMEVDVTPTDIKGQNIPESFALKANYPNPFNPSTQIAYNVPKTAKVKLEVFNTAGKRVATLVNGQKTAGRYNIAFDAANLPSGIYIYRMKAGDYTETRKMTLIK